MNRQAIIAGNWKMHLPAGEAAAFVSKLASKLKVEKCAVYIAPPFTSIEAAKQAASGSSIQIGAQNMSEYAKGAYTGEVSSEMLKEAGASFVLVGHSERRQSFHEDDATVHRKIKWALAEGLQPILCIGETAEEREGEQTQMVLEKQLSEALKDFSNEELSGVIIAYEPVWAIGTGKTATPETAQATHHLCRQFLAEKWGAELSDRIPILYGGSVKAENIATLISEPDIDGALVGGASIEVESFLQIIQNTEENLT